MGRSGRDVLVLAFCFLGFCFEMCSAAAIVDVYRMIQYDWRGRPFGSRTATLNHLASTTHSEATGADITRAVIVVPAQELNLTFLNDVLAGNQFIGGMLLLLPQKFGTGDPEADEDGDGGGAGGGEEQEVYAALERLLLRSTAQFPLYFGYMDKTLGKMYEDVLANEVAGRPATATTGGYKLVVSSGEPKRMQTTSLYTVQAWLPGAASGGPAPTIIITAPFDAFGAVPGLASGVGDGGSAAVVLLELARLFSRLYSSARTQGRYNLLFALTSGAALDHEGTRQWLASLDSRLVETVDMALCIGSVGRWQPGEGLHMHFSKPAKDPALQQLLEVFSSVALDLGTIILPVQKKINISDPRVAWEHEHFSRRRVLTATISEVASAPAQFERNGGLRDKSAPVRVASVVSATKLVGEALARHIYPLSGAPVDVFAGGSSMGVSAPFVEHWLKLLASGSRATHLLSKTGFPVATLQKTLADSIDDVAVLTHAVSKDVFVFYDQPVAALEIYQVASVTFDLYLIAAISGYLCTLFLVLHITTKGLDDLIGVFRRPSPRKGKMN